tara:strand:- start:1550 stop:1762 length:213 start_codon:yes stop_codon:yes gene_type:complete
MEKNKIQNFTSKEVSLEHINGGVIYEPTASKGSTSWNDENMITESGETDSYGDTYSYNVIDERYTDCTPG